MLICVTFAYFSIPGKTIPALSLPLCELDNQEHLFMKCTALMNGSKTEFSAPLPHQEEKENTE